MSNAKIVSLIAHETRQVRAEDERARTALAADLYDALRSMVSPLYDRIKLLELNLAELKERIDGTESTQQAGQSKGSIADPQDQGREGQDGAKEAGPKTHYGLTR